MTASQRLMGAIHLNMDVRTDIDGVPPYRRLAHRDGRVRYALLPPIAGVRVAVAASRHEVPVTDRD